MRTLRGLTLIAATGAALVGCDEGADTTPFDPVPLAAVRFVNAVPDTMAMDYRFVDIVTNAGMFDATFRGSQAQYQPLEAGQHTFRVFLSSFDATVASTVVDETTFSFQNGAQYTVLHAGFLRSGSSPAAAVTIAEDDPPTPAAGKVALRVIHLGAGMNAVDVFVGTNSTSGETPAPAASWTSLAYGDYSPYVEFDTAGLRVAATDIGTTTPLVVANTAAPAGAAASGTSSAIAGVRMAGSALTIVILPPSVTGSMAPQSSAFQVPAVVFLNDRRPPDP